MDRSTLSRLLAKALAYQNCGKAADASYHAGLLVLSLIETGILTPSDAVQALRLAAKEQAL